MPLPEKIGRITKSDKIQNRVFVDLQSSKEFDGGEINYGFSALHVTIDDPQDMARVVADVKALPGIDWNAFTVEVDNETYENAAAPLATLNELVVTLLVTFGASSRSCRHPADQQNGQKTDRCR